jgi:hypothetical protein
MMCYAIEETAVYAKYVRWCGRTGSRGPSYPIEGHDFSRVAGVYTFSARNVFACNSPEGVG